MQKEIQRFSKFLILCLIILSLIAACSPEISEQDKAQLLNLVEWNAYYLNIEDMNGYMWTLHPESPLYQETQSTLEFMFNTFDLSYEIEEAEVVSVYGDKAEVRVIQVTRKIAGTEPFRDNRIEALHTFKKNDAGEWKIFKSEFDNVEYIDSVLE